MSRNDELRARAEELGILISLQGSELEKALGRRSNAAQLKSQLEDRLLSLTYLNILERRTVSAEFRRSLVREEDAEADVKRQVDRLKRLTDERDQIETEIGTTDQDRTEPAPPAVDPLKLALTGAPPRTLVEGDDIGVIAAELEPLLASAERFVADDAHPPELRAAVDARRRTLLGELRMFDVPADAIVITRSVAFLVSVLADTVVAALANHPDAQPLLDDVSEIVTASDELGDDDTAVAGGETMIDALDSVAARPTDDTAWEAFKSGGHEWLRRDFWTEHVNKVVATLRRAGALAVADHVSGGTVTAIAKAGWALLRARFPGIFP